MLLGSLRVSKAEGSQVLALQRDAVLAAGGRAQRALCRSGLRPAGRPASRRVCQALRFLVARGMRLRWIAWLVRTGGRDMMRLNVVGSPGQTTVVESPGAAPAVPLRMLEVQAPAGEAAPGAPPLPGFVCETCFDAPAVALVPARRRGPLERGAGPAGPTQAALRAHDAPTRDGRRGKPRHNLLYTSGSLSRLDFLGENPLS